MTYSILYLDSHEVLQLVFLFTFRARYYCINGEAQLEKIRTLFPRGVEYNDMPSNRPMK